MSDLDRECCGNLKTINKIGALIDLSSDLESEEGVRFAISKAETLIRTINSPEHLSLLHYNLANAWACFKHIARSRGKINLSWDNVELERELLNLRIALKIFKKTKIEEIKNDFICRVLTNLGNLFSHIGRFCDAIECWEIALKYIPSFSMAIGNRGYGLVSYSNVLYDSGHKILFLNQARKDLSASFSGTLEGGANNAFQETIDFINKYLPPDSEIQEPEEEKLGSSDEEINYRKWVLKNKLFLNPLNDISTSTFAANDVLTLPSIVMDIGEGPYFHAFFNQIKQEYASARFLYFDGIQQNYGDPHFSDRRVLQYNTLDYPIYSLSIEKVKACFTIIYSIFDKIAFLLNHYFKLHIPDRKVSFRTFWYVDQKKTKPLRSEFTSNFNWPLRGLFWLSKDIFEQKEGFRESIEPDAEEINTIRNHIAHKYLKVHDELCWRDPPDEIKKFLTDKLAYSVIRSDLEDKTLRLLKLVRASLVYLSLGIHVEEGHRAQERDEEVIITPMFLDTWEDDWKV